MRLFLLTGITIFSLTSLSQNLKNDYSNFNFDKDLVVSDTFPVYYDLRNSNRLSPVKVQSSGGCWASSAMASVESLWRTRNYGNIVLSDINLKMYHGFDSTRNNNGNHYMATSYLSRRSGPLPKNPESDSLYFKEPKTEAYITDARYLPNDPGLIKQTIMDFGAVYSMMYFRREHVDSLTSIFYTSKKKINHAINLVGWNDTIQTDTILGAWIAQNSLGESFADSGFFYIPYNDPNILEYNCIWPKWMPFEESSKIYYYDTLGSYYSYGFRDSICYGLVKYTAETDLKISKIGSFINHPFTKIYAEVYKEFDTSSKVLSRKKEVLKEITCKYAGYYTFDLLSTVKVNEGDDFFIMMRYVTPNDTMPLPVETYIEGYSDPHITSKKCWVNPNYEKWPTTWYECGSESEFESLKFDLCIKAYCIKLEK